jgi:predicted Rossmann fold nucleotide-binding protein DprA/Smf involved in DNA uptake
MYCRQCPASEAHMVSAGTGGSRRAKHRASPGEQAALPLQDVELTPQETALRLLAVMDDVPASSKKLARRADLEWSENLRAILKALAKAGKVKLEDGGWRLV